MKLELHKLLTILLCSPLYMDRAAILSRLKNDRWLVVFTTKLCLRITSSLNFLYRSGLTVTYHDTNATQNYFTTYICSDILVKLIVKLQYSITNCSALAVKEPWISVCRLASWTCLESKHLMRW